jgi:hypothetical protein
MVKASGNIADELSEMLRKTGQAWVTLTWSDFRKVSEREPLKQPLLARRHSVGGVRQV